MERYFSKNYLKRFFVALFLLEMLVLLWFQLGVGNAPYEKVSMAAGLFVQFDGLLAAGYLGGLFLYGSILLQKFGKFPWGLWSWFLSPFLGFALSGLSAVAAVLTGSVGYLELAAVVFVYVLLLVLSNLYRFHKLLGAERGRFDWGAEVVKP
jgi:hypothetical protein